MSTLDLSGKPALRYPDPLVKRVNPNGTQEYTAYQALFVYYAPAPANPELAGYYAGLSGLSASGNTLAYMLFGSDYPAIVTLTSTYPAGGYFSDGTVNQFKNMTFNETAASPVSGGSNLAFLLRNGLSYVGQEGYKRILTGPTLTNGVTVSGFNQLMLLLDHGIYATDPTAGGDPPQPDLFLRADVVLNAATVHSTSPYVGVKEVLDSEGPTIGVEVVRQPIILWEPSLTQKIVDDGYIITSPSQLCGPTIFDVVGIWSIEGYTPPQPTPPPADVGARSFAAPSSGMTAADEALLTQALTGLSSVQEAVKKRR
jgi:hypothetical protein